MSLSKRNKIKMYKIEDDILIVVHSEESEIYTYYILPLIEGERCKNMYAISYYDA